MNLNKRFSSEDWFFSAHLLGGSKKPLLRRRRSMHTIIKLKLRHLIVLDLIPFWARIQPQRAQWHRVLGCYMLWPATTATACDPCITTICYTLIG